ncbi:serine hydrolase [Hymenobacter properus]|uniref:Serine hydrolase n=1 Tax=Hymenobacter properus TaxID=2791026 RepID=A0A931BK13_9BACT|nr:serine hydrolase [Hymenobacter properus]MBF9143976.1 serine hydrolase [Hymenobacter properus]MBR7722791.1 serine hydrolase [Microvirga sp. SRT04]
MPKHFTLYSAALFCLGSFSTWAQEFKPAQVDSLLNSLVANKKMMGSLAVSHDGKELYSRAFGYTQTDGATTIPAAATTRYRVGSISKVFTATMIFQLIEEKKLTLETPLATFFPQLPNAQTITIDHLLSHHSGLHNFTNDAAYKGYMTQPQTRAQMLARMADMKPDFEPGTKAAYSNTNFVLLGYIVEDLTKMPYAKALEKRVVNKIGLKNTYYGGKITPRKQEALPYEASDGVWKLAPETDMSIPGGAGSVVSTPTDLNHFLEALFGGQLVSAASLEAMKTVRDGYGRGLLKRTLGDRVSYGHGGAIDEFRSDMFYFPAEKLTLAITANAQSYPVSEVARAARWSYFGQPYALPHFEASTYVPAAADLDRYVGTYANPKVPLKITMTRDGNTLKSQGTGQSVLTMEALRKDVYKFDRAGIVVVFDANKPSFMLKQGGVETEFVKE